MLRQTGGKVFWQIIEYRSEINIHELCTVTNRIAHLCAAENIKQHYK